jgi:iron complex transport system substrate-binding protein
MTRAKTAAAIGLVMLALAVSPFASPIRQDAQREAPRYSRIVSLVPAVTEMLFAMGAGDAVAGISSYDRYPPEALTRPKVGGLIDPDFERILSLRPDLVITYGTQSELIDRLRRANIGIYNYEHAGLADITATLRSLGQRIGRRAEAERLAASLEQHLADVRARVAGRPRPRTALIIGRELGTLRGVHASAGVGFLHDLLETAGGIDVFDDVKRQSLQVSTEVLLARAPEVILELHPPEGWTPEKIARERAVWQQLPSLPAVRRGRIHILTDHRLIVPGPRVGDAARMIADLLHPPSLPSNR